MTHPAFIIPDGQLIGLSLSLCVRDMIVHNIPVDRVSRITTGTAAPDEETFLRVVNDYAKSIWRKDRVRGIAIALDLWNAGKIDQPRLRGEPCYSLLRSIWVRVGDPMPERWQDESLFRG
jgi:hypothetical protein